MLADTGLRAIAVDLPGHGLTGGGTLPVAERGPFLDALLKQLAVHRPLILISPSMSGSYALPYVNDHAAELDAWLPVAAVGVSDWATKHAGMAATDARLKTKVVAVYGDRDERRSDFAALEATLPQAQFVVIPDAGHACYVDNPTAWHRELVTFLENEIL
jgi:abhydrolase domain-containing protein 14